MERNHDAVAGEAGVGLQIPETHVNGSLEGRHGVLRSLQTAAAMGERQRPVVAEIRRQIDDNAQDSDTGNLLTRWVG